MPASPSTEGAEAFYSDDIDIGFSRAICVNFHYISSHRSKLNLMVSITQKLTELH